MPIPIQLKRSTAAGVSPTTLADGEVAINVAASDPKIFFKDSASTIRAFSLASYASATHTHVAADITDFSSAVASASPEEVVEYLTTSVFPATGSTTLLYLATDASRAYRWTGSEYVEVGTSTLSASGGSAGSRALTFLLR